VVVDAVDFARARRSRLVASGVPAADAETLTSARELADYFEETARHAPARLAANWVTGEVLRWMKEKRVSPEDALSFPVSPARLAGLLRLLDAGEISAASAKEVLSRMIDSPLEAAAVVSEKGLARISDASELDRIAAEIVAANPAQADLYRSGKTQTFGWFVGQVMKRTGGRGDPGSVRRALTSALGKTDN